MGIIIVVALSTAVLCAVLAIRAKRLLSSALWLAATSALLALTFYLLDAPYLAVLELSVGAGLVTVLFVFAISLAGEIDQAPPSIVAPWVGIIIVAAAATLAARWLLPLVPAPEISSTTSFRTVLWEQRGLDTALQVVLIFTGGLGLLHLLSDQAGTVQKLGATDSQQIEVEEQPPSKELAGVLQREDE